MTPPTPEPDRDATPSDAFVLVVDDNEDALLSTQVLLERPGLVVLAASSAEQAERHLAERDVALALLDVKMPRVSGFELAERMRENERTRAVPIIFVTGDGTDPTRRFRGYEAGAVDFLLKPVEPRVLESKVGVFVELYAQRRELRERNAELERLAQANAAMAEELRRAHGRAVQESLTDALTGLPNRRHILQLAETRLADRRRQSQPLTLAILDIDHFKRINDGHGHPVGDAVLRGFAQHVEGQLRSPHALGRLGGEEFLLLMPGTTLTEAETVMERLRTTLPPHAGVDYTFSAGIAQAAAGEDVDAVIARADAALYEAKNAGRDRYLTSPAPL